MNPVGSFVYLQVIGMGSYLEFLNYVVNSPILFLFNIPIYTWVFECSLSLKFSTLNFCFCLMNNTCLSHRIFVSLCLRSRYFSYLPNPRHLQSVTS